MTTMTEEADQQQDRLGRRLEQMEDRYFGLLEAAPDAMVVVDEKGVIVLLNLRAKTQFGYSRDELLDRHITTIIPSGFAQRLIADSLRPAAEALGQQIGTGIELIGLRKDGSEFPIEIMLSPLATSEGLLVTAAIRDITLRRLSENGLIHLNRLYAMLSGINALIVRVQTRDELFHQACRLAVESGGFSKAWIGLLDAGSGKLQLAASVGVDPDLIDALNSCCIQDDHEPFYGSLVARAVRERRPMYSSDPRTADGSLSAAPPRTETSTTAVLPLLVGDEVAGMIALYSGRQDCFDEVELKLLTDLAGNVAYAIASIDKQEQLSYSAYYDVLTGLANRKLFLECVSTHILGANYDRHRSAVFIIDIEGFKNINDSLGQIAGDSLLKLVANWLRCQVGTTTLLARTGIDQFGVMLPVIRSDGHVARVIKKFLADFMEQSFHLNGADIRIAAKIGVALFPDDAATADELFRNAEAALKRAKQEGNRYLFYTEAMTAKVASRLALENQLRSALAERQFVLHYQSMINLASGKVSGAEALIRWNHPEVGLVPPGDFVPILEETGMIHEVGRWVVQQAIEDYLRWRPLAPPGMRISVNVSELQLRDPGFVAEIRQLLNVNEHAAKGLKLEITEGLMMLDVDRNIKSLNEIRAMGVTIAIDDFGTGYSSLSHLTRLPLDTLKIDRTFVQDMMLSSEGHVLVHAIISLAHLLDFNVVAEAVETEEQATCLRKLNCNEAQGFLFSRPVPAEVFEANLRSAAG